MYQRLFRMLGSVLSGQNESGKLLILTYHRVLEAPDPLMPGEPDVVEFDWQIKTISNLFNIISFEDALHGLKNNSLPPRAVCITFDDGYSDNYHLALPILKKYQAPAMFFIATGFLNDGIMWNDMVIETLRNIKRDSLNIDDMGLGCYPLGSIEEKRESIKSLLEALKYLSYDERINRVQQIVNRENLTIPHHLMMKDREVKQMFEEGMSIGAHTVNHPILAKISDEEAEKEILDSRAYLESIIGSRVKVFAYPNGRFKQDFLPAHVEILRKANFDAAVTTDWGYSVRSDNYYQMPRIVPWDNTPIRFALRMLKTYM